MNVPTKDVFATLLHDLTMTRAMLDGAHVLIESCEHSVGDDSLLHAQTLALGCLDRIEVNWTTIDAVTNGKSVDIQEVCANLMGELTLTRAMLDAAYQLINASENSDTDTALAHAQTLSMACIARLKQAYNNIDSVAIGATARGAA